MLVSSEDFVLTLLTHMRDLVFPFGKRVSKFLRVEDFLACRTLRDYIDLITHTTRESAVLEYEARRTEHWAATIHGRYFWTLRTVCGYWI